jgi:hypothetical protein
MPARLARNLDGKRRNSLPMLKDYNVEVSIKEKQFPFQLSHRELFKHTIPTP